MGMTVEYAKDPKWANKNRTSIDITVKFLEFNEEVSFTAEQYDIEEHGRILFEQASNGFFGPIGNYVNPISPEEQYIYDRIKAYPSIYDQLDLMYHKGYEGWREKIEEIKLLYPKPNGN